MSHARLSEDAIKTTWDSGHQSLQWTVDKSVSNLLPKVDFKALLEAKDPEQAVQSIDRRAMYLALSHAGQEDALEIMPLLSQEQFVAIIDYEGWHDNRLSIHNTIKWLDVYKHLGVDQMFKRYRELDEEYQIGLLSPYIDMVDEEEFEKLSQDEQDQFQALPCNTLWYRVKGGDQKVEEFVGALVQGGLGEEVAYIYSLLAHAARVPPNEQENLMMQFRNARLEEDGFALPEESRELFAPFDGQRYYEKFKHADNHSETLVRGLTSSHRWQGHGLFLDAVLGKISGSANIEQETYENLKISFLHLANMMSTACRVQPDDLYALTKLLDQSRHMVSLGLEVLAAGQIARAQEILLQERPKIIFQFGLSIINSIREDALEAIQQHEWPGHQKLATYFQQQKFGSLLWTIDTELLDVVGFETTEMLKGLFNRFPMVANEVPGESGATKIQFHPVGSTIDVQKLNDSVATLRTGGRSILDPITRSAEDLTTH